jgi:methyl-accepting chemotaxis protein
MTPDMGTKNEVQEAVKATSSSLRDGMSLRRRYVVAIGAGAIAVLIAVAAVGGVALSRSMSAQEFAALSDAARRSALLVDRVLAERLRQVDLIAWESRIIDGAKRGTEASRKHGFPSMPIPALEERFRVERSQQVDDVALDYLLDLVPKLDIAEVILTDVYGFNAVVSSPSNDFVQSDEAWWQNAWKNGITEGVATQDKATGETVVEIASAVRDHGLRVGVVKVKFSLGSLDTALFHGSAGSDLRIDLVDSVGHIVATSVNGGKRFDTLPGFAQLRGAGTDSVITFGSETKRQIGVMRATNSGRWRLVAHADAATEMAPLRRAQFALFGGTGVLLLAIVGALMLVSRSIELRITGPAAELALLAEAVAAGDLSREVMEERHTDDEIGRLGRAIDAMIAELRRLASAMGDSARETASMSAEITAGTEEMAASAGEIAHTASDLSQQSSAMALSIHALSGSSNELLRLATELREGGRDGVQRNNQLRALALESRARLDESAHALESLSTDVQESATAIDNLATASLEVRTFVALVQKLARQSKLLALNAAMEAARAGEQGEGFAVVASEVRRLSAMSSEAAQRTERVVGEVLKGIDISRASSERSVATVRAVREATEHGARSFGAVEDGVASAETWTKSIEQAAIAANTLVGEITERLTSLSGGTESFAAAMQQVAASSEEQSASTEQIAAAATAMMTAAERLSQLVAHLRLEQAASKVEKPPTSPQASDDEARERRDSMSLGVSLGLPDVSPA